MISTNTGNTDVERYDHNSDSETQRYDGNSDLETQCQRDLRTRVRRGHYTRTAANIAGIYKNTTTSIIQRHNRANGEMWS